MLTTKKKTHIALGCLFFFCLFVFLNLMQSLSVGFYLVPKEGGAVQCQQINAAGESTLSEVKTTEAGYVAFKIAPSCKHFNFVFKPSPQPYYIKAISVFGVPAFSSNWILGKLTPSLPISKESVLPIGQPLPFVITSQIQVVDYSTFFDKLLALFQAFRMIGSVLFGLLILSSFVYLSVFSFPERRKKLKLIASFLMSCSSNKWVFYLALLVVALMSLPPPVIPVGPGLDPSWIWYLNQSAFEKKFGTQMVFTYGPLGCILFPQSHGFNVYVALVFNIIYLIIWGGMLIYIYKHNVVNKNGQWCMLLCALIPIKVPEWQWTVLPILLMGVVAFQFAMSKLAIIIFSALSAFLCVSVTLMKFSSFTIIFSTCIMVFLYLLSSDRIKFRFCILSFMAAFATALALSVFLLFQSFSVFFEWCRDSMEMTSGYNLCMLFNKSCLEIAAPYLYVCIVATFLTVYVFTFSRVLRILIFAPLCFCLIKYAILRQNIDPMLFVGSYIGSLLAVFADTGWKARCLHVCYAQLLCAWILSGVFIFSGLNPVEQLAGISLKNVRRTIALSQTVSYSIRESSSNISVSKLPQQWLDIIGTNTIQSLPFEASYLSANGLNAVPLYVLQGYVAYTHNLDLKSSQKIQAAPPEYLICQLVAIDGRHLILESPAIWMLVQNNYSMIAHTDTLLLLKRKRPISMAIPQVRTSHSFFANQGEWIDVNEFNDLISIEWKHTLIGSLAALLFRNDFTFMTIEYGDGTTNTYRILPDTLRSPISLDRVPRNFGDFKTMFTDAPVALMRARRIRFDSNNGFCYDKKIRVNH